MRPARALIDTINEMTVEEITQVSPNSLRLKKVIKAPLLLMITASGMMSGISISMLKLTTELIQAKAFLDSIGLVVIIVIGAFLAAFF